jgi:hypothetical protein
MSTARYGQLEFREKLKSNGFDLLDFKSINGLVFFATVRTNKMQNTEQLSATSH